MTSDDAHTSHSHGFELPELPPVVVQRNSRPWRALAGVAVCLGLMGVVTGLIVAHRQSVSDERLISDALQREELRDGWRALGAAAAQDAQANAAQTSTATSAPVAPPNVVIVNVPAQSAATAPSNAAPTNVTNINMPSGSATAADGTPTRTSTISAAPIQSLPAINFSPVEGYVPTRAGESSSPVSDTPQINYLPQNSYGTTTGGVPPTTPGVGNGSIPGSSPNPALPNNGLVGTAPVPALP